MPWEKDFSITSERFRMEPFVNYEMEKKVFASKEIAWSVLFNADSTIFGH